MSLLADIQNLVDVIDDGEWPGVEVIDAMGLRVRTEAPDLSQGEIEQLAVLWADLEQAVRRAQDAVLKRLKGLDRAQGALKGYAHLRPHHRGQRLRRTI